MPNKKVKCKKCNKLFEPLSPRGFVCDKCKAKAAAARKSKRQAKGKKIESPENIPVKPQIDLDGLFPEAIWEQRPVDIDTFLFDNKYLGRSWINSEGKKTMFPAWEQVAHDLFPLPMRSPYNTVIFSGATGIGKFQPNSCEILTQTGSIKFGDIKVNDEILGTDGKTQKVVGVFPQGKKKTAKVIFNDGSSTLCGYEHLWTIRVRHHGEVVEKVLTTEQIVEKYSNNFGKAHSPWIPEIQPIEYPEKQFKCDPYVLGAFLGNGCCTLANRKTKPLILSSGDSEVPEEVAKRLEGVIPIKSKNNHNWKFYKEDGLPLQLNKILPEELVGSNSYTKFIPEEYFYGSVEQRIDLLRGLMDTDGSALLSAKKLGRNKAHYSSVSRPLAEGVVRLARSLGMFASIKEYHRVKIYKGVSKEKTCYKVSINSKELNPFLINRKSSVWTPAKQFLKRKFKKVEYYGEEDCTCIKVSNPDELYLTNDFIVTHNTSAAMGICAAYYLHIVMCLRNPHEYFALADSKNIVFSILNIVTKAMAYKNAWGMLHKMLLRSPWFLERGGSTGGRRPEWYCTTKPVELIYGKCADDVIGLDILFCFMDEISFGRNQSIERQIEIATEVFDAALERMKSRFIKFEGIYEGLMVMASSKRTDQSFLEGFTKKLLEGMDASKVYLVDKPRWEVLPPESYSGKTFPVAVGDKFKPSQVITEEQVEQYTLAGYTIIRPPIENYDEFDRDIQKALTNIAGLSVGQISSFLRGDIVQSCINKARVNLFRESVIFSGYQDNDQYYERIDLSRCSAEDYILPLFIHIDASMGSDGNSIVGTVVDYAIQGMTEQGVQPELHYRQLFKVKVRAPKGTHTGLSKNRQLVFWLRQQGFNVRGVSFDQYQSFESIQLLEKAGFNVKKQSIDAVKDGICQPYEVLKNALFEKRIELLDDEDQITELVQLEKHENGKVDKPRGGHDDTSQCLAGSVYLASQCKEELLHSGAILLKNLDSSQNITRGVNVEVDIGREVEHHFAKYSYGAQVVNEPSRGNLKEELSKFGISVDDDKNKKTEVVNPTMYWG